MLTVPVMNPTTGDDERTPVNLSVAQEVIDYLFKPRPGGRVPWLDDPERFEWWRKDIKKRLLAAAEAVSEPPRKTWQEHAWLLRQGEGRLSWEQVSATVGKPITTCREAVKAIDTLKAKAA